MKKYFIVTLVLLIVITSVKGKILTHNNDSNEILLEYAKVASYMAKRFMSSQTNTLAFIEYCSIICSRGYNYHDEILNNILNDLNDKFAIQLFLNNYDERLWDYNIFIVDSYKSFQ